MELYNLQVKEHRAMKHMLTSYCRHHHGKDRLCVGCLELHSFIDRAQPTCPGGQGKLACENCQQECLPGWVKAKLRQISNKEFTYLALRHPFLALNYWRLLRRQSKAKAVTVTPVRA